MQTSNAPGPSHVAATYFSSWRAKDFTTLRSLLADDVQYVGPLARLDSGDACRDSLAKMADITTDVVVEKVFVDHGDVLTWFTLHSTIAQPVLVANWMHVENGKIKMIRALYDPRPLTAAG